MAAKEVHFHADARERMLRGVDILANAVKVMRLYWPKETPPSILPAGEGTWQPPGVAKAS